MEKRKLRGCKNCHYRQYYRKRTNDWRCDRCGFISGTLTLSFDNENIILSNIMGKEIEINFDEFLVAISQEFSNYKMEKFTGNLLTEQKIVYSSNQ